MLPNTLKGLALAIQLAMNALALTLVTVWPYNALRRPGWPQIDEHTFLIGAVLVVVVLGMIPVLYPRLCPDRNSFGRALLLTGWPLILLAALLGLVQRVPLVGIAASATLLVISAAQSLSVSLAGLAVTIEKGPG